MSDLNRERMKDVIVDAVAARQDAILAVHRDIHAHPEVGLQEHRAAHTLVEGIRAHGIDAEAGVGSLPTAIRAETGTGELVVTLCAEYDALPGVGHGCGHNVIAGASFGAFIVLSTIADELGITVRLLGTPAEENAGGKVVMLNEGAFDGTHAAMMVHPAGEDVVQMDPFASGIIDIAFTGKEAHASASPHLGVNALDALTLTLTAIGLARQQLEPYQQIHGIVIDGGSAPNVIPGSASGRWMARAADIASLERVLSVIRRCAEGAAVATGATVEFTDGPFQYAHLEIDNGLSSAYIENLARVGRTLSPPWAKAGSTDMGNVSLRYPSIHPMIGLGDPSIVLHTAAMAALAGASAGDRAVLDGAILLACTAVDAALDPDLRHRLLTTSAA